VAGQQSGVIAGANVMDGHSHAVRDVTLATLTVMWFGMMAAMMAPTAWPWVRAYHRFHGARGIAIGATARFASGYLLAWLAYAIGAALLQRSLQRAALMEPSGDAAAPYAAAVIFAVAGVYQFAPSKRACLTHCRSPLGYFLTRWRDGPVGALRMGAHHGLFCVGCCWALMITALAVGAMNLWWMTALGIVTLLEQTTAQGERLRRALGGGLLIVSICQLGAAIHG
jgi:predicted metal-binding membrane protein